MEHIYLPINKVTDFQCYEIRDKDTIRAYKNTPRANSNSDFIDFYVNSHYLEKSGNVGWGQYPNLPTCINSNLITNEFYYRNDIVDILLMFTIIIIFGFYLPYKIFSHFCRRFFA